MVPDPEFFAQCIRDSFQELLAIADKRVKGRKRKAVKVVGRRKAAARKKAA
jgi:hypothetical protein